MPHGVNVIHRSSCAEAPQGQGRCDVLDEANFETYLGMKSTLGRIEPTAP